MGTVAGNSANRGLSVGWPRIYHGRGFAGRWRRKFAINGLSKTVITWVRVGTKHVFILGQPNKEVITSADTIRVGTSQILRIRSKMEHVLVVEDSPEISALIVINAAHWRAIKFRRRPMAIQAFEMASVSGARPHPDGRDDARPQRVSRSPKSSKRKSSTTRNIPLIFVTAKSELNDLVHGLETAVDYISKPFAVPELVARVRSALRMKRTAKRFAAIQRRTLARLAAD